MFDEFLNEGQKELNKASEKFAKDVLAKMKILKGIVEEFFSSYPLPDVKVTECDEKFATYDIEWWFIEFMKHEHESYHDERMTIQGDDGGFMHKNLFFSNQGFYNIKIKGASQFTDNLNVGCDGKSKLVIHVHIDANKQLSKEIQDYIARRFDPLIDLSYFKSAIKLNKYNL